MLASREEAIDVLRCPRTGAPLTSANENTLICEGGPDGARHEYPILNGVPVVINYDNSVLREKETVDRVAGSVIKRTAKRNPAAQFIKNLLSPAKDTTRDNVTRLIADLTARPGRPNVLIIGGGSVGQGMAPLYEHPDIKVFSFDIYASSYVQFVADAHNIPAAPDTFDAVVIQAVLEHTLEPNVVVEEIWRVLKSDGLVYAETPFMQQVHEGAYDFTRFSDSGHRYLFRRFELLKSGASGGPGRQFMWSADYLFRSVFRSRAAGKIAKLAVFWAQYLDALVPEPYAVDAASGVYFYGRKSTDTMSPGDIAAYYKGAQ